MNKLWVVGIGQGGYEGLTVRAARVLEEAEVLVGYILYCELIKPYFPQKTYRSTSMMEERERCRLALELAVSGKRTAMICSGDAGVYGMASPVCELAAAYGVQVEVVPGVTAALAGAALLGAPLGHDYLTVSLSDLLTPMERIRKRIAMAAECDLCLAIYNPASKKRRGHLAMACDILLEYRDPDTPCGVVRNAGREDQSVRILPLKELRSYEADMVTTVFVGNSTTRVVDGRLVTPRGYRHEG